MTIAELWNFDEPEASRERFLAAGASAEEPQRSRLLTQAARAEGLLGNFAEGHRLLDGIEAVGLNDLETKIRVALERGRLYRSAKLTHNSATNPQPTAFTGSPAAYFESAASLSKAELNTPVLGGLHIDALHMQALAPNDFHEQIRLTRDALQICESSTEPSAQAWRCSLLNNLACAHADAGEPHLARELFVLALDAAHDCGEQRKIDIATHMLAWIEGKIS